MKSLSNVASSTWMDPTGNDQIRSASVHAPMADVSELRGSTLPSPKYRFRLIQKTFETSRTAYDQYAPSMIKAALWNAIFLSILVHGAFFIWMVFTYPNPDERQNWKSPVFAVVQLILQFGLEVFKIRRTPPFPVLAWASSQLDVFHVLDDRHGARRGLSEVLRDFVATEGRTKEQLWKYADARLVAGQPSQAALGINAFLGWPERTVWTMMGRGLEVSIDR